MVPYIKSLNGLNVNPESQRFGGLTHGLRALPEHLQASAMHVHPEGKPYSPI